MESKISMRGTTMKITFFPKIHIRGNNNKVKISQNKIIQEF